MRGEPPIPPDWTHYISTSFNRLFLNPASGCEGKCRYCYIYDFGHGTHSKLFETPLTDLVSWIENAVEIIKGRNGFLFSIGSSCDPFEEAVVHKTIDLIEAIAPFENPIQVSTKFALGEPLVDRLCSALRYKNQLVLFGTVTTFDHWKRFEPGTRPPDERLDTLQRFGTREVPTCIAIKPYLPSVAGNELQRFLKEIKIRNIGSVLVGSLYANQKLLKRLRSDPFSANSFSEADCHIGTRPPPSKTHDIQAKMGDVNLGNAALEAISFFSEQGVPAFHSAPCVSAYFSQTLCATGVWRYLPHLCVKCNVSCEKRFHDQHFGGGLIFPRKVEGLLAHE